VLWGACSIQDSWVTLGRSIYYLSYYYYLFIFRLRTLLLPPFKVIWFRKGVYGASEGGDNKGGRLDIWGGLRPCCTPAECGAIHAFENIRVYIECSHC
jgi:hypothetical protein